MVDAHLRVVVATEGLDALAGPGRRVDVGTNLLDVLDDASRTSVLLAARRVTDEVVLSRAEANRPAIVARAAKVGGDTWLILHEQHPSCGRATDVRSPLVGRRSELAELDRHLVGDDLSVLYLHGPLGIGKTALLTAFAARCEELGCPHFVIDAAATEPSGESVAAVVTGRPSTSLERLLATVDRVCSRRWALLVDNFDAWQDVAERIADRPFRSLPVECRIVVAARRAPRSRWWDASPRSARTLSLGVLPPGDAAELQAVLGVSPVHAAVVTARAQGHPLCITTLAATVRSGGSPDVRSVPLAIDFAALGGRRLVETAAIPARFTEDVLAALLDEGEDATAAYEMLTALSVPDPSGIGMRLPDVVRESVRAGLRERSPSLFATLQARLLAHYGEVHEEGALGHLYSVLDDFLESFDDHPVIRRLTGERRHRAIRARRPEREDRDALLVEASRCLGEAAVADVIRRFDSEHALTTWIEEDGSVAGILQYVTFSVETLGSLTEVARDAGDRQLVAALELFSAHDSLGPDEHALVVLAWVTRDVPVSRWSEPSQALFRELMRVLLSVPRLASTVFVQPNPPVPLPTRRFGGAVVVKAEGTTLIHRSVRGLTARAVFAALVGSSEDRTAHADGIDVRRVRITTELVREALSHLGHPERLAKTPLLALRVVARDAGPESGPSERADALARILRSTVASLQGGPREQKQREVLLAVFLERNGKHETIAADLGLPYSTFRRYLARGVERVAEVLRLQEDTVR